MVDILQPKPKLSNQLGSHMIPSNKEVHFNKIISSFLVTAANQSSAPAHFQKEVIKWFL